MINVYEKLLRDRLVQLRTQKGVSARDMSLSIGQSESYINKIENGKALPSMESFFYICEYLGLHPKEFFSSECGTLVNTEKLLHQLAELDEDSIASLRVIIEKLSQKE